VAYDKRQYSRWHSAMARHLRAPAGGGLTGASLERAVMGVARTRPNLVAMPGVAVRRMQAHPPGAQP
jgi:hypothetical protein